MRGLVVTLVLHMYVAMVTPSCTRVVLWSPWSWTCLLPWLPHPAHVCCRGYVIMHMYDVVVTLVLHMYVAVVTLVLHMYVAMVTSSCTRVVLCLPWSCTRLLPWLCHPAHVCRRGYAIMHTYVAVITPSCTRMMLWLPWFCTHMLPWLPHPAHTWCCGYPGPAHVCCHGYEIMHTLVAVVTPSCTCMLP